MQIDLSKKELAAIFEGLDKWAKDPPIPEDFSNAVMTGIFKLGSDFSPGSFTELIMGKRKEAATLLERLISERQNEAVLLKAKFLQAANRHEEHIDEVEK